MVRRDRDGKPIRVRVMSEHQIRLDLASQLRRRIERARFFGIGGRDRRKLRIGLVLFFDGKDALVTRTRQRLGHDGSADTMQRGVHDAELGSFE